MGSVDQLSSDQQAITVRLYFDLDINLIGPGPIKHLPDAHCNRARSWRHRLRKAVIQQLRVKLFSWRPARSLVINKGTLLFNSSINHRCSYCLSMVRLLRKWTDTDQNRLCGIGESAEKKNIQGITL